MVRDKITKSQCVLDAILKETNGASASEGLDIVASPISFFLVAVADMTGKDRRKIMELFFEMVYKGVYYPGEVSNG